MTRLKQSLVLLLLLLLSTNSDGWSFPFFSSSSSSNSIDLHPRSPREADPEHLRVRRQAYQITSADGETSVTVDHTGGNAESGSWGQWQKEGDCSRTCGGGVYKEKRSCNGDCTGASVRYLSCNLDACPDDSTDFRSVQCAQHDDDPIDGKYYKWTPYAGANKCELTCKPESASFYYKWADKVVDGTKCDHLTNDICVDGVCLPLGCDGKLGSTAKADKCGVCNGTSNTCKGNEGVIKESTLTGGYNDLITLPVGATSIKISETKPTSNSLALKNESGHYFLNGNHQLQLGDGDVAAGGTVFKYQKPKAEGGLTERLTAAGPLKEPITVQLLFQRGSHGSAVKFEYWTPLDEDVPYIYKPGEWSSCSVTCGKGVKTRSAFCTDVSNQQRVDDEVCEENNATKPVLEKDCQTVDCEAEWFVGDWESCSESCGSHGWQYRVIYCHRVFANGKRMTVDNSNCTSAERPPVKQTCNRFSCPEWHAGPWSACSEKCGDAKQYRSVTCRSEKEGDEGKLLPADQCPEDVEHQSERRCNLGPCDGLTFSTTDWDLCERCNDTQETRNVTCQDDTGRKYPLEKCLNEKVTEIPTDTRPCATQPPCTYEWHVSEWSKCSTECGHGHKNRKVHCAINELGEITILDESLCTGEKPQDREECVNEEKCTGTYFTGPWSNCSAECGGGKQSRLIACLNYDKKPVPEWCDESERPAEEQDCNEDPCPNCNDSQFGCCPDNTTFAQGDWLEGCSNCSVSEFGCCADNFTLATGPNGEGCEEFVESAGGSGEEPTEGENADAMDEDAECEVTNEETGEMAKILCSEANKTAEEGGDEISDLLMSASGNETEAGGENDTIHCSKTEFGCCFDWYTPAEGPKYDGCPSYVLGSCNETKFGCCPDNVTLARGPNLEACGEPTCAGSKFGCCPDRKTIAFGPRYAGCERSSFPCELSNFGCCPDGQTAALGKNGTGCGVDCLLSKYGCCPDRKTTAKGPDNEGCGCEFSQYGCCSDGKTPAQGTNFAGCPQSCAQSTYGCCADGKTAARGANKEGCPCQYTTFGCCQDGETTALGPNKEGCDDCRHAKHGCCPDGESKALGPNYQGCPTTTPAPYVIDGTVSPKRSLACNLPQDKGRVCHHGYQLAWWYDTTEGRCTQFWYGGCDGNDNRYGSQEECEAICLEPPSNGRCYLPKVEGPQRCTNLVARYYYDYQTKQCAAFWYRGCLGNSNNFGSWEDCQSFCRGIGPIEEAPAAPIQARPFNPNPTPEIRRIEPAEPRYAPAYQPEQPQQPQQYQPQPFQTQQQPQYPSAPSGKSAVVCNLPKDVGRCTGHFSSYYYDRESGVCELFQYSGCGGNANRFQSRRDCEDVCLRQAPQLNTPALPAGAAVAPNAQDPRRCEQPKDQGPCTDYTHKWFYNSQDGTCSKFYYGGCQGNSNRFETEGDCRTACGSHADPCTLPAVKGPCEGNRQRFYFDAQRQTCAEFVYGGCMPNSNNFATIEECEQRCKPNQGPERRAITRLFDAEAEANLVENTQWSDEADDRRPLQMVAIREAPTLSSPPPVEFAAGAEADENLIEVVPEEVTEHPHKLHDLPELCELPEQQGTCYSQLLRYRYDLEQRACVSFNYTGCNGNANLFDSIEACDRACGLYRRQDVCNAPPSTGNCQLRVAKWHYDPEQQQCRIFFWSGCGGNGNRFSSASECAALCSAETRVAHNEDACLQPRDSGPCLDAITQWYYDPLIGDCRKFTFGGCRGNSNRMNTQTECQQRCRAPAVQMKTQLDPQEICSMPFEAGPCQGVEKKWFFDINARRCRSFTYSTCGGNENRFESELDCFNFCKQFANRAAMEHKPRPRVVSSQQGAFTAGSTVELRCVYEAADLSVVWMRNDSKLSIADNMDRRYTSLGNLLRISDARPEDGGRFTCASGHSSILSEPLTITIQALPYDICADRGSAATCTMVKRSGLCSNVRYGRFCCRTCSN